MFLCEKIKNVAYIKGEDWANDETSWREWNKYNFSLIASNIPMSNVIDIYNQSKIGLILSGNTGKNTQGDKEGASYSTCEYLLSGLPVVSTYNQGGRNFWLNEYNSITCNADVNSVYNAHSLLLYKLNNNMICRTKIRNDTIILINKLRDNFINKVDEILAKYHIKVLSIRRFLFFVKTYPRFTNYNNSPEYIIEQMKKVI